MAVYLLTLHSYGSWLPDREQGYVRRDEGILPTDDQMAGWYRADMTRDVVKFSKPAQEVLIDATLEKCGIKHWTCHGIATDPTHVHALLSWRDFTAWESA